MDLVQPKSHKPFINTIEGCDYDINHINEQYEVKINGNRISKKKGGKFDNTKPDEIFKGEIGSNGLPKGFDKKLKCPMIFAGNWKFLQYKENGKYNCKQCHRDVYTVTTLEEMKTRLSDKQCVRIVYYNEDWVVEEDGDMDFSDED